MKLISSPKFKKILLVVILGIVVLIIASCVARMLRSRSQWTAVFLTNNQVYFGHFSYPMFGSTASLRDIYYLRVDTAAPENQQKPEALVIKFGNEIHGPEDKKIIPKDSVLLWEHLRADSAVVQAIEADKLGKANTPVTTQ